MTTTHTRCTRCDSTDVAILTDDARALCAPCANARGDASERRRETSESLSRTPAESAVLWTRETVENAVGARVATPRANADSGDSTQPEQRSFPRPMSHARRS